MANRNTNHMEGAPAFLPPEVLNQLADIVIARLQAQNETACLTRRGSEVQILYRPPSDGARSDSAPMGAGKKAAADIDKFLRS